MTNKNDFYKNKNNEENNISEDILDKDTLFMAEDLLDKDFLKEYEIEDNFVENNDIIDKDELNISNKNNEDKNQSKNQDFSDIGPELIELNENLDEIKNILLVDSEVSEEDKIVTKQEETKKEKFLLFINDKLKKFKKCVFDAKEFVLNKASSIDLNGRFKFILFGTVSFSLAFLIGTSLYTSNYIKNSRLPQNARLRENDVIKIIQTNKGLNSRNFNQVSEKRNLGKNSFNLSKFLIDTKGTHFYFEQPIDWKDYIVKLVDEKNNDYKLDINFYKNNITNELNFNCLDVGTKGAILYIEDKNTGEVCEFPLSIDGGVQMPPTAYLTSFTSVSGNNKDYDINIINGNFSPSGSSLFYEINWDDDYYLNFDNILISGVMDPLSYTSYQYKLNDENKIIGRIDTGAVSSLENNIKVKTQNLFKVYDVNKNIDISNLILNKTEYQKILNIKDYNLTLERLGKMNENYVLVFNCKDKQNNNIQAEIDATLNLEDNNGQNFILEGKSTSGEYGTDMLFNINQKDNLINNRIKSYELNIKSLKIKENDCSSNINLAVLPRVQDRLTQNIIDLGKNYLLENNNNYQVENLAYTLDSKYFTGVYILKNNNKLDNYVVKGVKDDNSNWEFNKTLLESKDLL